MQYRKLGRTGVEVSNQCLGAMMFGAMGNTDHDECIAMVHTALDAGINFIDTADVYSAGESELIVGKALAGRRDQVVLATKFFNQMGDDRNRRGGSRRWITEAVEGSLTRLGTDYIDLYQMHRFDWHTDLDDTLGALTDLVRSGKVRYIGSSSYPAEGIVEAQWIAEKRRRERFVCEQPQYSIFARSTETSVLATCQRYGMGVIPWSPLAGGWLTGKYRRGAAAPAGSRFSSESAWAKRMGRGIDIDEDPRTPLVEQLATIADQAGITLTHMALAFVDSHPAVTAAIIGPRTSDQLDDVLGAANVVLDSDTLDAIDKVCKPGRDAPRTGHFVPNPGLEAVNRRR